ncbi:MAG: hypothetical protein WAW17_01310 [Rhodococcus sp. (in: high G+C Gram-positive bacteria)]|uniref:hypothetical protein n=1 Tax=Rhodococcus sp. TaxID=1831 RepID=UPI003BB04FF7
MLASSTIAPQRSSVSRGRRGSRVRPVLGCGVLRAAVRWAPPGVSALGVVACVREGSLFGVVFYLLLGAPHAHLLLLMLRRVVRSVPDTAPLVAGVSGIELATVMAPTTTSSVPSHEVPVPVSRTLRCGPVIS